MSGTGLAGVDASIDTQFRGVVAAAERLAEQGRSDAAQSLLRLAVRLRPGSATAQNALGIALFDDGRMAEALDCFERATRIDPRSAGAWSNAGMVLKTLDRFDESLACHDRALAIAGADGQLRLNRAVAALRAGRMAQAWPDYESRLVLRRHAAPPANLLPTLDPDGPDLEGRSVLVRHEEGYGDTLQFIRYAPLLARRGARVTVAAPAPLRRLLARVAGVDAVAGADTEGGSFDFVCPTFSLPRAFATRLETIPGDIPYLGADPALIAEWDAMIRWRDPSRLRVGLVWAGQARPWLPGFAALDRRRSAGLAALAPLGALDAEFVSLQMPASPRRDDADPFHLHDPTPGIGDFADTAAVIANLDVVVSVDTSVVHLAGGMGKTVLMLDRFDSCWRWLSGRTDSPWYPTLRIFRQPAPGDWSDPVQRVAETLAVMPRAKERRGTV